MFFRVAGVCCLHVVCLSMCRCAGAPTSERPTGCSRPDRRAWPGFRGWACCPSGSSARGTRDHRACSALWGRFHVLHLWSDTRSVQHGANNCQNAHRTADWTGEARAVSASVNHRPASSLARDLFFIIIMFPFVLLSSFAQVLTRPQPSWEKKKEAQLLLQESHIVSV